MTSEPADAFVVAVRAGAGGAQRLHEPGRSERWRASPNVTSSSVAGLASPRRVEFPEGEEAGGACQLSNTLVRGSGVETAAEA